MTPPLRIVLATDKSGYMAPVIPALTGAGARIVAHIAPPVRWRKGRQGAWRYGPTLARHAPDCRTLPFGGAEDWPQILAALEELRPDLIVSAYFMARIPAAALALARLGGVNLHPARLPWYAGAAPLHHICLDGTEDRFGGLTLHVLTAAFDAGPIIAAATLPHGVWARPDLLHAALGGAGAALCSGPLQDWIDGRLTARDQPAGPFPRASLAGLRATIPTAATAARLFGLMRFFPAGMTLDAADGPLPVGPLLRRVGPPSGSGPRLLWPGRVRFDCADARMEARQLLPGERHLYRVTRRMPSPRPRTAPIAPAAILTADQNAAAIAAMAACSPSRPGATSRT